MPTRHAQIIKEIFLSLPSLKLSSHSFPHRKDESSPLTTSFHPPPVRFCDGTDSGHIDSIKSEALLMKFIMINGAICSLS